MSVYLYAFDSYKGVSVIQVRGYLEGKTFTTSSAASYKHLNQEMVEMCERKETKLQEESDYTVSDKWESD